MKIIKIFDIILNISDINIIFSKNINEKILDLISNTYTNKNYLSSYIVKINKILNRSLIESNQNDLNCSFNIHVQFEADCIVYNTNEVIIDMEIQEIINNNLICKNNNILALIKNNTDLQYFSKTDKIPIRIGKVKYSLGTDKITINAYPFIPIIYEPINYKLININKTDLELLNENIIKYILEEENRKKDIIKIKNNTWDYFNKLIYPYNNININNKLSTIDLLDFINNIEKHENSIICLNDRYNLSDRKLLLYKDSEIENYISNNSYITLYDICKKYYLYLKLINDLSILYNSEKLITDNNKIFDIYNKYKHE